MGAGAEVRQGGSVRELIRDGDAVVGVRGQAKDKTPIEERAKIVIGADGLHSIVAREVGAEEYHTRPTLTFLGPRWAWVIRKSTAAQRSM